MSSIFENVLKASLESSNEKKLAIALTSSIAAALCFCATIPSSDDNNTFSCKIFTKKALYFTCGFILMSFSTLLAKNSDNNQYVNIKAIRSTIHGLCLILPSIHRIIPIIAELTKAPYKKIKCPDGHGYPVSIDTIDTMNNIVPGIDPYANKTPDKPFYKNPVITALMLLIISAIGHNTAIHWLESQIQ